MIRWIIFWRKFFCSFLFGTVYEMLLCPGKCKNLNGPPSHINNNNNTSNGNSDVVNQPYLKLENFSFAAPDMKRQYSVDDDDRREGDSPDTAPATKIPHNENLPTVEEFTSQYVGKCVHIFTSLAIRPSSLLCLAV